ncbi:protein kinase [Leptolyngbya sp. GB1-A1]|uniref:protein kinase domain-containing protein n=1 Tax=Leptolyngbya sp. GB1-A1 TaxID=2933908 RepID=UPI00329A652D
MSALIVLAPGTLLHHRYEIIRPLGGGGFSQVFEIRDGDATKVLKVLDLKEFSRSQQQKAIELFRREATFLSQFHHRGVPQVEPDGYFVWQRDRLAPLHCLVMEKVPGINLQEWLQQGKRLSAREAIDWMHQLVEILIPLHQQQFFHRDIKPSNIMLRPDGQLMLIDFGTVREVSVTYLVKQEQQETGTAIISAGYTPPEQAEGQAVPQSDFFALGRTLVTLLTRKPPIDLPVDPQTGQLQWRTLTDALPPQFADLLDRLMAPFPGQRPQSGEIILQTIRQIERKLNWERRLPVLRQVDRLRAKLDRRLFQITPLKTALLLVMLFSSFMLWENRPEISNQFNNWGLDAQTANAHDRAWWFYQVALLFNQQNAATLFNLGDLYETQNKLAQARAAYTQAMIEDLDTEQRPDAYNNLARLYILNQEYHRAILLLNEGRNIAKRPIDHYALLKNLGWAQLKLKQYDVAQETLNNAVKIDDKRGTAYCLLGQVYEEIEDIPNTVNSYRQCLQYGDRKNSDEQQWMTHAQQFLE